MIKRVTTLGLFLISSIALPCELPPGEELQIGCSYHCDVFYRFRLKMTGWGLGYKTKIVNLQHHPDMTTALSEVDGVLIPGGADIDPKYYLPKISPELRDYTQKNSHLVKYSSEGEARDPFEYSLLQTYSQDERFKTLPLLGICRGMQMMSVAQGIPLYLDIKTELGIKNRYNRFDRIHIAPVESRMSSIYKNKTLKAFKFHHQGIRVPYYLEHQSDYPLTKVTAFSHDQKIAESLEYTHREALGVQYHPEKSFSHASVPVFRWFLKKACEHKNSLKENL